MTHPGEPVGDAGALLGNLLEDSGPSVADDVVVALQRADVSKLLAYIERGSASEQARVAPFAPK